MPKSTAKHYVDTLQLTPHIEGGYFNQNYQSQDSVKPTAARYQNEERRAGTSIFFLLEKEDFSACHTLNSDEIWHFYDGCPVLVHTIDPQNRRLTTHILGHFVDHSDANLQCVVVAGQWFAAETSDKTSFSLVGCTVNPGFDYKDFRIASRDSLVNTYPEHTEIIEKLTR